MSVTSQAPAVHTDSKVPLKEFVREGKPPTEDYREQLFELEAKGELKVHRVPEPIVEVETKFEIGRAHV